MTDTTNCSRVQSVFVSTLLIVFSGLGGQLMGGQGAPLVIRVDKARSSIDRTD